jgi:hypothetical protein
MNAAFRGSIEAPNANRTLPCELTVSEAEPKMSEDKPKPSAIAPKPDEEPDVTNIIGMSADDIRQLLRQLSQEDNSPAPTSRPKKPETPATPITRTNRFQGLVVEEAVEGNSDSHLVAEATCERQPRKPQWEKKLPRICEVQPDPDYEVITSGTCVQCRQFG